MTVIWNCFNLCFFCYIKFRLVRLQELAKIRADFKVHRMLTEIKLSYIYNRSWTRNFKFDDVSISLRTNHYVLSKWFIL